MKKSKQTTMNGHVFEFTDMELKTLETLKTIKDKVKYIAEKYPCTRGDYRLLYYYFLKVFGYTKMSFREFEDLRKNPSPESITRAYRLLVEDHPDLKPTERVQKKRIRRQEIIRGGIHEV